MTDCSTQNLLQRLKTSPFRARFHLSPAERTYLQKHGLKTVMTHGQTFIQDRLAPTHLPQDGRQTPMRGHPVFTAQHATASCCRGCLAKWHNLPPNRPLTDDEQAGILTVIRAWILQDAAPEHIPEDPAQRTLF